MTSSTASTTTAPAAARRTKTLVILIAVGLASMMLPWTVTGTAVALPHMATDLSANVSGTQWVLNAYNVAFAACLLAAGSLADRFGRRRVMVTGVIVYVLTSLVCALANNILLIDIARAVQGVGAAGVLSAGAAVLAATFEGPMRARAFGVLGTSFGFGLAAGPLAAGALVQVANWRAFFLINALVGVVVIALSPKIKESLNPNAGRVDWGGMVTFSASLVLLTYGFVEGPAAGWASPFTVGAFVLAVLFMVGFVLVERSVQHPMFDLSLFKRPTFVAVVSQPFTIVFGFVILVTYLPPYFQGFGGHDSGTAGLLELPMMLPVLILPLLTGFIASRIPIRVILAVGSLLIAIGSILLITLQPHSSLVAILVPLLVFGLGVGAAFGVMDNAAVSVVPVERVGMASGIFNTMRITGETVAVAGAAALLSSLTFSGVIGRLPTLGDTARRLAGDAMQGRLTGSLASVPAAQRGTVLDVASSSLTSAMHVLVIVIAVLALIGSITTFLVIRDRELNPQD